MFWEECRYIVKEKRVRKYIFDQLAVSFDDSDKFDLKSFNGKASDKD